MINTFERPSKCFLAFLLACSGKFENTIKECGGSLKYLNKWK
jgi:hypothetical protein